MFKRMLLMGVLAATLSASAMAIEVTADSIFASGDLTALHASKVIDNAKVASVLKETDEAIGSDSGNAILVGISHSRSVYTLVALEDVEPQSWLFGSIPVPAAKVKTLETAKLGASLTSTPKGGGVSYEVGWLFG